MKNKGRKSKVSSARRLFTESAASLHFQLCHVCLYLNESGEEISLCKKCGEAFVPPEDPHELEDMQDLSTLSDPFHDWDQDEEARQFGVSEEEDDDAEYTPSTRKRLDGLAGLRVRW